MGSHQAAGDPQYLLSPYLCRISVKESCSAFWGHVGCVGGVQVIKTMTDFFASGAPLLSDADLAQPPPPEHEDDEVSLSALPYGADVFPRALMCVASSSILSGCRGGESQLPGCESQCCRR